MGNGNYGLFGNVCRNVGRNVCGMKGFPKIEGLRCEEKTPSVRSFQKDETREWAHFSEMTFFEEMSYNAYMLYIF